ncbi:MAG: helix-turn-helix domain-containing protein [Clostridia bacterium]|nr:helix-turn-helix domain-containing protein [Clostridia bacterium]
MIYRIPVGRLPDISMVGHLKYRNGWSADYCHRYNVIFYIHSGEFRYDFSDGKSYTVKAGCHHLIPKGVRYRVTAGDDCDFYYAHFYTDGDLVPVDGEEALEWLRKMKQDQEDAISCDVYPSAMPSVLFVADTIFHGDRGESIRYRFSRCEEYRYGHSPLDRLRLSHSFFNLLLTAASSTGSALLDAPKSPSTLTKITSYIGENYTKPISLAGLADEFGLSKQYIMRLFREQMGTTVSHYVNSLKLRKSLDLLRFTGLSISEVAYSLGYSSVYYFCRIFKKNYQITPSEYQRTHRIGTGER